MSLVRNHIADYLSGQVLSVNVRVVSGEIGSIAAAVARAALTFDAIIIGDDQRKQNYVFDGILRSALFRTAAGILLNATMKTSSFQPKSVLVAWKATIPSARAVRAALPMLRDAEIVTVALFDPKPMEDGETPGSDVAAWLTH